MLLTTDESIMKRYLPLLVIPVLFSSCAGLTTKGSQVQEAQPEEVRGCEYISEVEGNSTLGGIFHDGPKIARAQMLNKAGEAGATHVVVIVSLPESDPEKTDEQSWATAYVKAKAYKCPDDSRDRDPSSIKPKP